MCDIDEPFLECRLNIGIIYIFLTRPKKPFWTGWGFQNTVTFSVIAQNLNMTIICYLKPPSNRTFNVKVS